MSGDLEAYVRALREHADAPPYDARATEAKILAQLEAQAALRVRRIRLLAVAAALTLGATALAQVPGLFQAVSSALREGPTREVRAPEGHARRADQEPARRAATGSPERDPARKGRTKPLEEEAPSEPEAAEHGASSSEENSFSRAGEHGLRAAHLETAPASPRAPAEHGPPRATRSTRSKALEPESPSPRPEAAAVDAPSTGPLGVPNATSSEPRAERPEDPVRASSGPNTPDELGDRQARLYAAYERARRLHFTASPAEALAVWDAFLAHHPEDNAWTTDARYRRGVVLWRLRRWEEARQALSPFAQGHYGPARAREAQRILRAMPGGTP